MEAPLFFPRVRVAVLRPRSKLIYLRPKELRIQIVSGSRRTGFIVKPICTAVVHLRVVGDYGPAAPKRSPNSYYRKEGCGLSCGVS